ncbi:hypothetical protein HNP29_002065 [Pseudomonas alcaligenes]|nr:hypothetical protein [Pseudomonas alcaligenes]
MAYLFDGPAPAKSNLFLAAFPQGDYLNEIFPFQNLIDGRLALAEIMLRETDAELSFLTAILHEMRLNQAGWSITHRYLRQDNFFAEVGGSQGDYEVHTAVGTPLIALSVAIELCSFEKDSPIGHLSRQYRQSQNSIEDLFPAIESPVEVGIEALDLAMDTCLLLYFHELAHALYGHCDYSTKCNDELRALEFDADFNAGAIFGAWLGGLPDARRKARKPEQFTRRLVRAAFTLGVILKAVSARSAKYHLPTNRTNTFMAGGAFALTQNKLTPNFQSEEAGNIYWGGIINKHRSSLQEALRKSSLAYASGTENEIEKDSWALENITSEVRDRLKDGPLNHFKLKY